MLSKRSFLGAIAFVAGIVLLAGCVGRSTSASTCPHIRQVNSRVERANLRCITATEYAAWLTAYDGKKVTAVSVPYEFYVAESDFTLAEPAYGAHAFTVILRKGVGMSAPNGLGHVKIFREDGGVVNSLGVHMEDPLVVRSDGQVPVHRAGLKGKLRLATVDEYTGWLKEYLEAGGAPKTFYDYEYSPEEFYFAESNFTFVSDQPFYGSGSVEIIVPKGIHWSAPKGMGHSALLLQGGTIYPKDEADLAWISVYTNTMPKGLSPAAQKRLTTAIARMKAEEKRFWQESKKYLAKQEALEQKFESELLPMLRPAHPVDYRRWLKSYAARGGRPTDDYSYPMPDDTFYVAESDFTVIPLKGALAVQIIVPKGIHWSAPKGFGHVTLYLADGYRVVGSKWVPTYSNADVS